MKQMVTPGMALIVALLALASPAIADVPQMISYQGYLTDAGGAALDTTVSMEFAIYDDSTGGVLKWTESHAAVTVEGGTFNVILGEMFPIDDSVFNQPDRWLGITVGSDPELSPRTPLVSIGYAHRVSTVDGSTGGIISGDVSIQSDIMVSGKATIGPGHTNTGTYSFVAGTTNDPYGNLSAISGGENNSAGYAASVAGGRQNDARADYAAIGGGFDGWIGANFSAIPGGRSNEIWSPYCMAFGEFVYLNQSHRVALFDGEHDGRLGLNRDDDDGGINHPIHVGTDGSNGNGAHLTAGGVWTNASSRMKKEGFQPLDGEALLNKVASMPVESWQYKGTDERHIGPVAEDFVAAFDVGTTIDGGKRDDEHLSYGDVAGVALASVQALLEKIERLETRIAELESDK